MKNENENIMMIKFNIPLLDGPQKLLVTGFIISHQWSILKAEPVSPKMQVPDNDVVFGFI
jgi:hypothetical protein